MKKQNEFRLNTTTDIKVFLLFILDSLGYALEHRAIIEIAEENTGEITFDYDECLRQLVASDHLLYEDFGDERYYMISDKGHIVATELYDTLDKSFRERSLRFAARHVSLDKRGARTSSSVSVAEGGRYRVTLRISDHFGELMSTAVTVNSREEAEQIKRAFDSKPDGVYRGVLFSVTGKLEFIS
ncbi:MAG: DUF4364 family protein [Clostridia bacterium]|nr:DUF4364 family protein [Clostridia bacterium]